MSSMLELGKASKEEEKDGTRCECTDTVGASKVAKECQDGTRCQ